MLNECSTVGKVYDNAPTDVTNRYTTQHTVSNDSSSITTSHCVNYNTLKLAYSLHDQFTIIKADIKKCLYREHRLIGIDRYNRNRTYETEADIIGHYTAFKDAAWPDVHTLTQFEKLPTTIKIEVAHNRESVVDNVPLLAAEATIQFHLEYYNDYPFNGGSATVIDIDTDDTKFGEVMRHELSVPYTDDFLQAWENVHG